MPLGARDQKKVRKKVICATRRPRQGPFAPASRVICAARRPRQPKGHLRHSAPASRVICAARRNQKNKKKKRVICATRRPRQGSVAPQGHLRHSAPAPTGHLRHSAPASRVTLAPLGARVTPRRPRQGHLRRSAPASPKSHLRLAPLGGRVATASGSLAPLGGRAARRRRHNQKRSFAPRRPRQEGHLRRSAAASRPKKTASASERSLAPLGGGVTTKKTLGGGVTTKKKSLAPRRGVRVRGPPCAGGRRAASGGPAGRPLCPPATAPALCVWRKIGV